MNSRERFLAICRNEEYDRLYYGEFGYWVGTLKRWYEEGLWRIDGVDDLLAPGRGVAGEFLPFRYGYPRSYSPGLVDREVKSLLGFDGNYELVPVFWEMLPEYEETVLEEDQTKMIVQDRFGVLKEKGKDEGSIPRYIGFPVKTRADFDEMFDKRFSTDPRELKKRYPKFWVHYKERIREREHPVGLGTHPFGIFSALREWMGLEHFFMTLVDDPDFIDHMLNRHVDFMIALYDDILGQVDLDFCYVWEDMAYKNGPLVSPRHFEKHFVPQYKRLTGFLKDHGIDVVMVDCDGDVYSLLPLFQKGGANYLFPMEVASGMDIRKVRNLHPDLIIGGGIDKQQIARGKEAIDKELEKVEYMLTNGTRWFPHIDHLVDPMISWEDFVYYRTRLQAMVEKARERKTSGLVQGYGV